MRGKGDELQYIVYITFYIVYFSCIVSSLIVTVTLLVVLTMRT